jgi:hypothetical protein
MTGHHYCATVGLEVLMLEHMQQLEVVIVETRYVTDL